MSQVFYKNMGNFIAQGPDGKPIFTGKSDPDNPPVKPREGSKMECQVCHNMFDYLLGENVDGGVQGCEEHWKAPQRQGNQTDDSYDTSKEII